MSTLVLERRIGERIILGDPRSPLGSIGVVNIQKGRVRISVDLPRDIEVNREEVLHPAIPRIQEARA